MGMAPLDYGPVLLRKPFGSRLAADTLPSGCPCGQTSTVGASPWLCPSFPTSCPHRVRHGQAPQPTRHYPRLWIHRPSSERSRDFNPPDQDAAQHTLRACPPPWAARSVPRGLPVGATRPAAQGFPCRVGSLVQACHRHYPGGTTGSRRFAGCDPQFPSDFGLPRFCGGSAPTSRVSRPARRSLALRPACSRGRQGDPLHRRLRRVRYLHRRSDFYRLERLSCRAGLAPAKDPRLFTAHTKSYAKGLRGGVAINPIVETPSKPD